jgi:hypothetical protein
MWRELPPRLQPAAAVASRGVPDELAGREPPHHISRSRPRERSAARFLLVPRGAWAASTALGKVARPETARRSEPLATHLDRGRAGWGNNTSEMKTCVSIGLPQSHVRAAFQAQIKVRGH